MRFFSKIVGLCCLLFAVQAGFSQTNEPDAKLSARDMSGSSTQAADLIFPTESSEIALALTPKMALYRPAGDGPHPALILLHQCGGLRSANGRWQNLSMLDWAKQGVAAGYVVLLIDAFEQRGATTTCFGPQKGVTPARTAKDVYQAADHLATLPFVNAKKIVFAGYSFGGMIGVAAASAHWQQSLLAKTPLAAIASIYPACRTFVPIANPSMRYEAVMSDISTPTLVLMGELDVETPPSECVPKLQKAKDKGAPVQWHVYPSIGHCWDCKNLNGYTKVDIRGTQVTYTYDAAITADTSERIFAFFKAQLK